MAWNGLITAGVSGWEVPNHMIEHPISSFHDIHHGAGLCIVIPAWMTYFEKKYRKSFAQFARNIFNINDDGEEELSRLGIEALKKWLKKIGCPISFSDANLPENDLEKLAKSSIKLAEQWGMKGYKKEDIINILKLCL